jgi:putative ABC transport system ATP-binding protein
MLQPINFPASQPDATFALQAEQINKTVPTSDGPLTILDDISFSILTGESISIVGASGSGKSTLLGILAGLDTPTSGRIQLMGKPFSSLDEDERARCRGKTLGFVFQSFQLIPHLTALENAMLPLELRGVESGLARTEAITWLTKVGLLERLHHFPRTLSGGEQQRVALARAFIGKPAMLFADEPTGSLDEQTGAKIIELLFALNQHTGSTLILVTHDVTLAKRCGRQLHLQGGRLLPE